MPVEVAVGDQGAGQGAESAADDGVLGLLAGGEGLAGRQGQDQADRGSSGDPSGASDAVHDWPLSIGRAFLDAANLTGAGLNAIQSRPPARSSSPAGWRAGSEAGIEAKFAVTVAIVAYQSGPFLQRCLTPWRPRASPTSRPWWLTTARPTARSWRCGRPTPGPARRDMGGNLGFLAGGQQSGAARPNACFLACLNPDAAGLATARSRRPNAGRRTPSRLDSSCRSTGSTSSTASATPGTRLDRLAGASPASDDDPARGRPWGLALAAPSIGWTASAKRLGGARRALLSCYCEDLRLRRSPGVRRLLVAQIPSAVVRHAGHLAALALHPVPRPPQPVRLLEEHAPPAADPDLWRWSKLATTPLPPLILFSVRMKPSVPAEHESRDTCTSVGHGNRTPISPRS